MVTCARCGGLLEGTTGVCRHCGLPAPTRADGPALVHQHTAPAPVGGGTTGLLGSLVTPVSGGGGPVASGAGLWPGQLVDGKYRVERILGQGGMGAVYLAFETTVETHVVLKALLPHLVHQPSVRERMIREARALARIDHPNVVRLNAVVAAGNELVLVMEYVEGHDLAAHLERWRQQGRPPIETCLALFGAVVDGVEAAHREGIVHRDIKPSNVLVRDRDGRVKVTDFGIAKSAADDLQLTSGMIGTLYYMAPEQLRADPSLDARADIYALGVLLYEMLTGAVPFQAASSYEVARQHIELPFPSLRVRAPSLPLSDEAVAHLDVVLGRACAKQRDQRYASCDELRRALAQCLAVAHLPGAAAFQSPASLAPHSPRPSSPHHASQPPFPASSPSLPQVATAALPPVVMRSPSPPDLAPASPRAATAARPPSRFGLALGAGALVVVLLGVGAVLWAGGEDPKRPPTTRPGRTTALTATTPTAPTPTAPATTATATATATAPAAGPTCSRADECKAGVPRNAKPTCHKGICSYECVTGFYACESGCFDLRSDPKNCGTCGNACKTGRCTQGVCATD